MKKRNVKCSWDMKCDVCGKTEHIEEDNPYMLREWWIRHWSTVTISKFEELPINGKKLDLCPTCTKKFKKLLMNVEIEESEE